MNIRIDRPSLNRKNAEANVALIDRWIADTADKLNNFASQINISKSESDKRIAALEERIAALEKGEKP